ncbi:MAG: PIN domain-containing protein [Desulfobacterales bacterium]|nr:PIN domain-containing protein [Desulfobacterales bacterium]
MKQSVITCRKSVGKKQALAIIEDLLRCIEVVSVDKTVILHALRSDLSDFEDAVQEGAAKQAGISIIVTRNEADFKQSDLSIYHPETFVELHGKGAEKNETLKKAQ